MALSYEQALSQIAQAGQLYNEAKARGDKAAQDAAHSYAQNIRSIAGIQGDGRTKTGLEGTSYAPKIEQLTQVKMQQSSPPVSQQPKVVRDTPYFVETQFDPRRYEMPKFEEPQDNQYGVVTPALKRSVMEDWLKKVGVMQDQRAFDYGIAQDAYNRRDAEKQYNESMALGFSQAYGVPIKPMGSLENLFAQVKGIKPLNIEERDYNRAWNEEERTYNREQDDKSWGYKYDERDYGRGQDAYTTKVISKVLGEAASREEALAFIRDKGSEMAEYGVDVGAIMDAIDYAFPQQKQATAKSYDEAMVQAINAAQGDPSYELLEPEEQQALINSYYQRLTGNPQ